MEINLPQQGCNIFYGTYIDNYNNNVRTRYYINDGELVANNRQSYTYNTIPTGAVCIDNLTYRSELPIYFEIFSIALFALAFFLIYKTIIKRLLP